MVFCIHLLNFRLNFVAQNFGNDFPRVDICIISETFNNLTVTFLFSVVSTSAVLNLVSEICETFDKEVWEWKSEIKVQETKHDLQMQVIK